MWKNSRWLACGAVIAVSLLAQLSGPSARADSEKNVNFRINPLGLVIFGELDGGIDFAIAQHVTLGPVGSYLNYNSNGITMKATGYGLRANFSLTGNRISDSWILAPFFYYIPSVTVSETDLFGINVSGSVSNVKAVGAIIGYQWVWNCGFNMDLALGAEYYSTPGTITATDSSGGSTTTLSMPGFSGTSATGEFDLGWAF